MRNELVLCGCRPLPLASYLKALGLLRLVAEQADADVEAKWVDDQFVLVTRLDRGQLVRFLVEEYRPTPIIAPWNGGSGFFPKDNKTGIDAIASATGARWEGYAKTIDVARGELSRMGLNAKPDADDKIRLLTRLRGVLPDSALLWMDAALLLTDDGVAKFDDISFGATPKYPPLLGTGGNDGRLDFTNNFMQRLVELLPPGGAPPVATAALAEHACFGTPVDKLVDAAIGQFLPGGAGGANLSSGFDGGASFNPWDFVLMLEGAVSFASAAVRRHAHEPGGVLAFPFTVHGVGTGYGSAAPKDESDSRAEMWLPLWERPASAREIASLLAEGRARVGRRSARNGTDFARAVVSLGVDRGLSAFERVGFQVRNGLSYLATPLGRMPVRSTPAGDPLVEVDEWVDSFRGAASDRLAPASAGRALRVLEGAVFDYCQRPNDRGRLLEVLVALGGCERVMVASLRWTRERRLRPIPRLDPARWWPNVSTSTELRLALTLASIELPLLSRRDGPSRDGMVEYIEPVDLSGRWPAWRDVVDRDVAWNDVDPIAGLCAILWRIVVAARRDGARSWPAVGRVHASLADIEEFLAARTDDRRFADLVWAAALFDYGRSRGIDIETPRDEAPTSALYGLCKLCFLEATPARTNLLDEIPIVSGIARHAIAGDGTRASELALRRLRASGLPAAVRRLGTPPRSDLARRTAAAVLFPIGRARGLLLARTFLRPRDIDDQERARGDFAGA